MTKENAAVNEVIAELQSEVGNMGRAVGPIKQIRELEFSGVTTDIFAKAARGTIVIRAYHETPYGDCYPDEEKFEVTIGDAQRLAQIAPRFQQCFATAAEKMVSALSDAVAAHAAVESWCEQGLPTAKATAIMKPLRWKARGEATP